LLSGPSSKNEDPEHEKVFNSGMHAILMRQSVGQAHLSMSLLLGTTYNVNFKLKLVLVRVNAPAMNTV